MRFQSLGYSISRFITIVYVSIKMAANNQNSSRGRLRSSATERLRSTTFSMQHRQECRCHTGLPEQPKTLPLMNADVADREKTQPSAAVPHESSAQPRAAAVHVSKKKHQRHAFSQCLRVSVVDLTLEYLEKLGAGLSLVPEQADHIVGGDDAGHALLVVHHG